MALSTKQRARQLQSLLDAVERGNKRDASDYTGGHLNEANLHKPPEFRSHKGWKGAEKESIKLNKSSKLPQANRNRPFDSGMAETLTQFSLGNDGFLPAVAKKKPAKLKPKQSNDFWNNEIKGSVDEQALIEEIDSRRFMLNRSQPPRRSWAMEDELNDEDRYMDSKSVPPKHKFYSVNSGATKRDQFKDFKLFESGTLKKQDTLSHKVLSGESSVKHLEQQLNRKLMVLGEGRGTAFHRLQAHSQSLAELTESSPLFSYLLKQIETEYDDYVGWLLDTHPTQSHLLREQVNDLYDKRVSNPAQLNELKRDTQQLENEGRRLLDANDRLRAELRKAKEEGTVRHTPDPYARRQLNTDDKTHFDLADQLQDLHATILEKLDHLDDMRSRLREEYVPSNVCQNLEQCLKDTEIEVQKLLKQNEIMEKNILEMQGNITSAVDECDVSHRDKQKCWEKVDRTRLPDTKRVFSSYEEYQKYLDTEADEMPTNLRNPREEGQSSDDEDEEQAGRWDWYIS